MKLSEMSERKSSLKMKKPPVSENNYSSQIIRKLVTFPPPLFLILDF